MTRHFFSGSSRAASRSIDHRNAASVLPDPVGATTSVLSPSAMEFQAPSWAAVGAAKAPVNHSRVTAPNLLSAPFAIRPTSSAHHAPRHRQFRPAECRHPSLG